jgi:hypothetical protein
LFEPGLFLFLKQGPRLFGGEAFATFKLAKGPLDLLADRLAVIGQETFFLVQHVHGSFHEFINGLIMAAFHIFLDQSLQLGLEMNGHIGTVYGLVAVNFMIARMPVFCAGLWALLSDDAVCKLVNEELAQERVCMAAGKTRVGLSFDRLGVGVEGLNMSQNTRLPLDELRLIQARQTRARDELQAAMVSAWYQLGNLKSEERQQAGRRPVIQLLGAYASKLFDLEAQAYFALKLGSAELVRCLDELAARVQVHMIPPQFRINSFFYLEDLDYDDAYRSHILSAIKDRLAFWDKGRDRRVDGCGSPREILTRYRQREKLTNEAFARKVHVDVSVIYGLMSGRKRCGPEALARIASLVGCEPHQLLPDE